MTLLGIAPPLSFANESFPMLYSDGRLPELYLPVFISFSICLLYAASTFLLFALGSELFDNHHILVKESFTLLRFLLTHSTGEGNLAGL